MVPTINQQGIWRTYRPGQEKTGEVSVAYVIASREARIAVWLKEHSGEPIPEFLKG